MIAFPFAGPAFLNVDSYDTGIPIRKWFSIS